MDDINMPVRDEYGSQPPLELVRLWHDYGYWFDRAKQWRKNVKVNYNDDISNYQYYLLTYTWWKMAMDSHEWRMTNKNANK